MVHVEDGENSQVKGAKCELCLPLAEQNVVHKKEPPIWLVVPPGNLAVIGTAAPQANFEMEYKPGISISRYYSSLWTGCAMRWAF